MISLRLAKRLIFFIHLALVGPTIQCFAQQDHAEQGFIDLTQRDIRSSSFSLAGEWEFYPDLLLPHELEQVQNRSYVHVPGSWHRFGNYPQLGVGTYRVRIVLNESQSGLVVYFPVINASSKVWVNGVLAKETGVVSENKSEYRAKLTSTFISLPDHEPEVELVVQVANYSYFSSGIHYTPTLALSSMLFQEVNRKNGIENFFAGSLIAMFIYQIILYVLFRKGKTYLWLSLICLGVALRALIVHGGSYLLPNLFPMISWEFWKKIEFGSVYAIAAFFPLYIYNLFDTVAPKKPVWFFVVASFLLCIVVVLTTQPVYGKLLDVAHLLLLLSFFYAAYVTLKAWRKKITDAKVIFYAVLASFPFILLEIIKNTTFLPFDLPFMYLVELGVLVYLLFQVYLLASHYARSFKNLEELNLNLERMVEERSSQLMRTSQVKDRLLSVISHDIKSPLHSLQGMLRLYNQGSVSKSEFDHYSKQIEADLTKTTLLVDNVLNWTAGQLKGAQIQIEEFDLKSVIETSIQLYQTPAREKRLSFHFNLTETYNINSDKNILNLVLRNLIANAVKFSHESGNIYINVKEENVSTVIRVQDEGVGMDEQTLQSLGNRQQVQSKTGTVNEKGTGLGLALSQDYLAKIGGRLKIESQPEKGSTFIVILPAKKL